MTDHPLKIVILAYTITNPQAGMGHFLVYAVQELARRKPEWTFKIIALSNFEDIKQISLPNVEIEFFDRGSIQQIGVKVLSRFLPPGIKQKTLRLLLSVANLFQGRRQEERKGHAWARLNQFDVIWTPYYNFNHSQLSFHPAMDGRKTPILFTLHDIHPAFYPQDWSPEALSCFWREFVPFAQGSDLIITHSNFQREGIIRQFEISPEKVKVTSVPPVIDPKVLLQSFDPGEQAKALSEMQVKEPYLLYPGSGTNSHKNHTRLLLAWAELVKRLGAECPHLVCTAKGPRWAEQSALIEELGLQEKVIFTGTVDTRRLVMLIQNSQLVVVPTLYEGGGSGPVTDAIIAGKPAIYSNIPPITEQLQFLGITDPDYFDGSSVLDIAEAIQSALVSLPELQLKACRNQSLVLDRLSRLWKEWTDFYIESMIRMVEEKSAQYHCAHELPDN